MKTTFRNYRPEALFGEDYEKLRDFLIRLDSPNYHFGRWAWMITHGYLDKRGLSKIGLWEEDGKIVAAATYDCSLGKAFLLKESSCEYLTEEMFLYAKAALAKENKCRVLIRDGDEQTQRIAAKHGFVATQARECDAVYVIGEREISYCLPEGFRW